MKDGDEVRLSLLERIKLHAGPLYDIPVATLNPKNFLVIALVLRPRRLTTHSAWQRVGLIYPVDDMTAYIDRRENGGANIGSDSSMFDGPA